LKLPFVVDKSIRNYIDLSINVVALSLACIMAGTGDVECLRVLRELRWKVEDVKFGTHMALGMAIGNSKFLVFIFSMS
jgi:anaphase-promoting complex subunit 1